jgi:probable selenium-dependent hydroxylase accessory protein YqeC
MPCPEQSLQPITITHCEDSFLFSDPFNFKPNSLVNFVGGGGKTILIRKLMEEFSERGSVLYTTTTRIHPPDPREGLAVISCDNLKLLHRLVEQVAVHSIGRNYKLVVTRHFIEPDLLQGVPEDFLTPFDRSQFSIFLNEADGAARFSIKLPREGEPVLMEHADYLVPVIGIDCLYRPLGPDVVFRFQSLAERFSLKPGELMTPDLASLILMHPQGVCKDWKKGTRIIPFINKVDYPANDSDAKVLASHILRNKNFPVKQVVWGSVHKTRIGSISDGSR